MKLFSNIFKSAGEKDISIPLLEQIQTGEASRKFGIIVNPEPRQRIERALGRIYRLFMKLEDLDNAMQQERIDPVTAKDKYEEIKLFNRYTNVLRGHQIEIPQNRKEWLTLFANYGIVE